MSSLPAAGYWSDAAREVPDGQQIVEDVRNVIAEMPGGGVEAALTIASGTITPAAGGAREIAVDTEGGAATDDLANIDVTEVPDGALILLHAANAARVPTVKHAAGGTGQFSLALSRDCVLDAVSKYLLLRRSGTTVVEIGRFGFQQLGDVAMLAITGATALTTKDSGRLYHNDGAAAQVDVTLPAAEAGLVFEFATLEAFAIQVTAAAADTIRDGATESVAAGEIQSTAAKGNVIRLVCFNTTEWVVMSKQGSWTVT